MQLNHSKKQNGILCFNWLHEGLWQCQQKLPITADKQGDYLSPLLFGLFIDQLEKFFTNKCGEEEGIRIADNICRLILYADDLAIMSESQSGFQIMLNCLEEFCQAYKMEVNISKSEVVVFNSDLINGRMTYKWQFKGQDLPIKEEFVYSL